jgi:hypothetical protein
MHRTFCAENTPVPRNHTWPILASAPSVNVHGITTYMPFAKIKWCCPYLLYCLSATLESFVEMHSRHHTLVLCKPWCTLHASTWKVETDSMGGEEEGGGRVVGKNVGWRSWWVLMVLYSWLSYPSSGNSWLKGQGTWPQLLLEQLAPRSWLLVRKSALAYLWSCFSCLIKIMK